MFETIQGSKLGLKLNKAFKGSDFKELTEEEFNNLSVTEQEEYKNKQEEIEDNMALQMEVLEEVLDFIVEAFDNQFTSIELQKGLPNGQEGIEKIGQLIGRITGGNLVIQKVRDRESEIRKEDLTPEAVYNNYRKIAKRFDRKWYGCRKSGKYADTLLFRHCRIED